MLAGLARRLADVRNIFDRSVVIGLCGPQGSGKSTMAERLVPLLAEHKLSMAILSIDDLYLTRAERERLAAQVHPLLATRGPPGTHDVGLGMAVLDRLLAGESLALPRFDKAMDDRAPESEWPRFAGPADIILFEGWCVGARAEPDAALLVPVNELEEREDQHGIWRRHVNAALADYQPLFSRIDFLMQLRPPGFETVLGWREEQEAKLRACSDPSTARGITSAREVVRFIQHYERLTRHIIKEMPARADLVIDLDAQRRTKG